MGSSKVMIGGMPAARMGDQTAHGGVITLGCPTVIINCATTRGCASASSAVIRTAF